MMHRLFIFKLLLFLFFACKQENNTNVKEPLAPTVQKDSTLMLGKKVKDSLQVPEKTINNFIKYYGENYDLIYKDNFVDYSQQYYRINFSNVDLFLKRLKSESFFTPEYRDKIKLKFKTIDSLLDSSKQDDGVPEGLEYDFILNTQDVDEILSYIKNDKFSILKENENTFQVNFNKVHKLNFKMKGDKILGIE